MSWQIIELSSLNLACCYFVSSSTIMAMKTHYVKLARQSFWYEKKRRNYSIKLGINCMWRKSNWLRTEAHRIWIYNKRWSQPVSTRDRRNAIMLLFLHGIHHCWKHETMLSADVLDCWESSKQIAGSAGDKTLMVLLRFLVTFTTLIFISYWQTNLFLSNLWAATTSDCREIGALQLKLHLPETFSIGCRLHIN